MVAGVGAGTGSGGGGEVAVDLLGLDRLRGVRIQEAVETRLVEQGHQLTPLMQGYIQSGSCCSGWVRGPRCDQPECSGGNVSVGMLE